jgi:Zinc knuckle.
LLYTGTVQGTYSNCRSELRRVDPPVSGSRSSLEEESTILSVKERSLSAAIGPPLRYNKCNKLGHKANRCLSSDRFPVANVKAVLSCFNYGCEDHVAKDCWRRPTYKDGVSRDTDSVCGSVSRDTDMGGIVGRVTQYRGGVSRGTDSMCGSVSRDTRYRGDVGRDTDELSRAQVKGWIRLENDGKKLLSNPMTVCCNK